MRIFGSDRLSGLMKRLGMEEGVPIEHRWVTKSIERAQKQVEGRNFDTPQAPPRVRRRHEQAARGDLPAPQGDPHRELSRDYVVGPRRDVSDDYVDRHCPAPRTRQEWDWDALEIDLVSEYVRLQAVREGASTTRTTRTRS